MFQKAKFGRHRFLFETYIENIPAVKAPVPFPIFPSVSVLFSDVFRHPWFHDFLSGGIEPQPHNKKKQKWDGFLATICSVTRGYLKRDPEPMAASAFVRCAMLCLKMWQIWRCSLSTSWFLRHGSFGWQVVLQFAERWDNKLYIYIYIQLYTYIYIYMYI